MFFVHLRNDEMSKNCIEPKVTIVQMFFFHSVSKKTYCKMNFRLLWVDNNNNYFCKLNIIWQLHEKQYFCFNFYFFFICVNMMQANKMKKKES